MSEYLTPEGADLASKKLIPEKKVLELVGVSRNTLKKMIREHGFPGPVEVAPRRIAFLDAEVAQWQAAKIKQRDEKLAA